MATFVGIQSATGTGVSTINVNVPAGVVDGDILVGGFCSILNNGATPAGWTVLSSFTTGTGPIVGQRSFWRPAASEPASYTFSPGNGSSTTSIGFIIAYRITASPALGPISTFYDAQISTVPTPASLTPREDAADIQVLSALHFIFGSVNAAGATSFSGFDGALNVRLNTNNGNLSLFVADEIIADCVTDGLPRRRNYTTNGTSPVTLCSTTVLRDGAIADGHFESVVTTPRFGMVNNDIPMELQYTDPNVAGGVVIIEEDM